MKITPTIKKNAALIVSLFFLFVSVKGKAQSSFITAGNASSSGGGCYILTQNANWQQGTAWDNTQIDLSMPFKKQYNLNFGTKHPNGADGIAFVLQNQGTGVVGSAGLGIGYTGITPSFIVEFDDWQNWFDPPADHVAINLNGDGDHTSTTNLGCPVVSLSYNLADGNWHPVQITWDPVSHTIQVFLDCQLVITYSKDITNNIFSGNPLVWWGFTSSTGARFNLQQFCNTPPLMLTTNINSGCNGQCNASASITNVSGGTGPYTYQWSNGQTSSTATGLCPGTYTVLVTSSQGCSTTDSVLIVAPNVLSANATVLNNVTCNGQSNGSAQVTVSGGNAPYTYSWSNGQTTQTATGLNASPGNYTVTVTDNSGCTVSQTVTITEPPPITATVSGMPGICIGQSDVLNVTAGGAGPYTYSWSPGNATTVSVTVFPLTSTNYSVTVADINGCSTIKTFSVTVNALPVISVSPGTICLGQQPVTLTAVGATTYSWIPSTGLNTTNGAIVSAGPNNSTTYTISGTDVNGCVNSTQASVIVNQLPVINVSPENICLGQQTATLTATSAITYSWSPPAGLSSTTGSVVTANPNVTTSYTVTGTDVNGCTSSASANVYVHPLPIITVNSAAICLGQQTATLTAANAITYFWIPSTGLSSSTGATVIAGPTVTTTYTLVGTDVNTCTNTAVSTVTVNVLPPVNISPQTTSGCAPLCVNFSNANLINGNYNWMFGDGTTSNSNTPNHCFAGDGTFDALLTLTDANGCVGTSTASVVVFPVPRADFNSDPQPTTILDPVIHFADASTNAVVSFYNWNFGNQNNSTSIVQNPVHVYSAAGSYPVQLIVTSDHGCRDSITKIIFIEDDYEIYIPNAFTPNEDGLNDIFMPKGEAIKDYKLSIFDRWGNKVFSSNNLDIGWDGRFQNNGDIVQEDVYVWKIVLTTFKGEPHELSGRVSLLK